MRVVLVIPFFSPIGHSCLDAVAGLEGVTQLGLVTHASADQIPPRLRARVQHYQIRDCLQPAQLLAGVASLAAGWGGVDRLVGYLEQLQGPLAAVRARLGIPGVTEEVALNFREKNRMKEVLRRAGVPVARQALLTGREDAAQ
ncbi:MAG: biotin carboxylase, partial [Myxococcota bacterium]